MMDKFEFLRFAETEIRRKESDRDSEHPCIREALQLHVDKAIRLRDNVKAACDDDKCIAIMFDTLSGTVGRIY